MQLAKGISPSRRRLLPGASAAVAGVGTVLAALLTALVPKAANAQQRTPHLDRLEMPGGPDDGAVLFRPVTQARTILFGQLALGYSHKPLRTKTITQDKLAINRSKTGVVDYQFTQYATLGLQLFDRYTVAASMPVTYLQNGQNPNYPGSSILGSPATTAVDPKGPSVGDLRLDFRGVIARSDNRKAAFGAGLSVFLPTGGGSSTNFGADGEFATMPMLTGEWTFRFITFVGNLGVHFRPKRAINSPLVNQGLGVGNELRWAVGAFIPLKEGKYRLGATIFGQTGIENDTTVIGDTFLTGRNSPVEWNVEGRMKFGSRDQFWAGLGGGGFIARGYGAPEFRAVGLIGMYLPIVDSDAKSPERKEALRAKWREERLSDADHDGIPDDIDACVNEPEDHLGSDPNDGCPLPPDRDGDGIPDQWDKCPDKPEDKDGIEDGDGCPEDDYDMDGILDVEDACPKAPGSPSKDPKKNGCPQNITYDNGVIRILQQVHFQTGSANILPDSFPMLQEIANLLRANASIKRVSIEGHTDNRGAADLNLKLSQARSESVMKWLVDHGIDADRLEAHGYGMTKPIDSNNTEAGRLANRRVEFKILDEADLNKQRGPEPKASPKAPEPAAPATPPPAPKAPEPAPPSGGTDMEL